MEEEHGYLKVERDSTHQSTYEGAVDTVSSTLTDTRHTMDTKTLYTRKHGLNKNVFRGSSRVSGSEPVEHDEEGEGVQLKEHPSNYYLGSESSGYAESWDSKRDHPVLDQLPHDPDSVMRSFILRSSSSNSSSQISDLFTSECEYHKKKE